MVPTAARTRKGASQSWTSRSKSALSTRMRERKKRRGQGREEKPSLNPEAYCKFCASGHWISCHAAALPSDTRNFSTESPSEVTIPTSNFILVSLFVEGGYFLITAFYVSGWSKHSFGCYGKTQTNVLANPVARWLDVRCHYARMGDSQDFHGSSKDCSEFFSIPA